MQANVVALSVYRAWGQSYSDEDVTYWQKILDICLLCGAAALYRMLSALVNRLWFRHCLRLLTALGRKTYLLLCCVGCKTVDTWYSIIAYGVAMWLMIRTAALLAMWHVCVCGVNVKWSRYRPDVAQRVGRVIALLFHDRGTRRGWVVSSTPWPHFTPGKDQVPILQEAGWAPGPVWTGGKSRPHRDSIPDRPARSQSLYRLSYPAHHLYPVSNIIGVRMRWAKVWHAWGRRA